MSKYKNVQNYTCKLLSSIKSTVPQETIALGHKIVICLNKEFCEIDCGWVPKGKQVANAYIPYYLTPDECETCRSAKAEDLL